MSKTKIDKRLLARNKKLKFLCWLGIHEWSSIICNHKKRCISCGKEKNYEY